MNYLSDCNRLDVTPYSCGYALIHHFDEEGFTGGSYALSEDQFQEIVRYFQYKAAQEDNELKIRQLGLNVMSIHRFLDADDMDLLDNFEENLETIKDVITSTNAKVTGVDDMPYLIAIGNGYSP